MTIPSNVCAPQDKNNSLSCKITNHEPVFNLNHQEFRSQGVIHARIFIELGKNVSFHKCIVLSLYVVAYLSSHHEKASKALKRARLGVIGQLSTTSRWRNMAKCLSQRDNKKTCRLVFHTVPLMQSVSRGSCGCELQSHWFVPTRNQARVYSSDGKCS